MSAESPCTRRSVPEGLQNAYVAARRSGWVIVITAGKHLKWVPPAGRYVITASTCGNQGRSISNSLAALRRAGLRMQR